MFFEISLKIVFCSYRRKYKHFEESGIFLEHFERRFLSIKYQNFEKKEVFLRSLGKIRFLSI